MADPKDRDADGNTERRRRGRRANTEVNKHIVRLDERIDDVAATVVEVRESIARIDGGMQQLVVSYHRTADFAAQQAAAELELRKSERLKEIEDSSYEKKMRSDVKREIAFKGMVVLMGVWAIIASALAAKC